MNEDVLKKYYVVAFLVGGGWRLLGVFASFDAARCFAESCWKEDQASAFSLYDDVDVMRRCIDGTYYTARK